jgi:uncharacterized protein (DUF952 family)
MQVETIYKLVTAAEWEAAWAEGVYRGSEQDQRDGFIHMSTAAQIAETARKYFSGVPDLVLLAIDIEMLVRLHPPHPVLLPQGEKGRCCKRERTPSHLAGEGQDEGESPLCWEPSRGGDLFPHFYALLPSAAVQSATPAPLADDGTPIIPHDLPS